jgi:formyl-CoA transferase
MWIVIGALSLLHRRTLTGRGGVVQGSLAETALSWLAQKGDAWANEGRLPERHPSGHPSFVPYEAFDASDGPFLICAGNNRLFAKLAAVLGHPEWAADARFRTNRDRLANRAALLGPLREVLRTRPRSAWLEALEAAGVPCAPIHTVPEALSQPQVAALGLVQPVPGGDGMTLTGLPLSFDGERPAIRGPAPALGADTARHVRGRPPH